MRRLPSPLSLDQAAFLQKQNNSKDKQDDSLDKTAALFTRAVSDLPKEKATALLHNLVELETTLRSEGIAKYDEYGESIIRQSGIGVGDDNISDTGSMLSLRSSIESLASESVMSESVASRYTLDKKYGEARVKNGGVNHILRKVGKAMHESKDIKLLGYNTTGRGGKIELLGPTLLRERLLSDFKLSLTSKEITDIMLKFDPEIRGVVDLLAVLGSAKCLYDQKLDLEAGRKADKKKELDKKLLLKQRVEYYDKMESPSAIYDATQIILEKLKHFSFEAMRTRKSRILHACRTRLYPAEFQTLLLELGVILSSRQVRILQKRYWIGQTDMIDVAHFKSEFVSLGKNMLKEIRKTEALEAFINTLSKGSGKLREEDQDETPKIIAYPAAKTPTKMTLRETEEWLNDPLLPSVGQGKKYKLSPNNLGVGNNKMKNSNKYHNIDNTNYNTNNNNNNNNNNNKGLEVVSYLSQVLPSDSVIKDEQKLASLAYQVKPTTADKNSRGLVLLEDLSTTPRELTITPDILQVSWNVADTSSRPESKQLRQGSRQGSRHGNRLLKADSTITLDPLVSTNFKPVKIE